MIKVSDIYPKQPKPLGVGSFLLSPTGELFAIGYDPHPSSERGHFVGVLCLTSSKSSACVYVPAKHLHAFRSEDVKGFSKGLGDISDWHVLTRAEAAAELAKLDA